MKRRVKVLIDAEILRLARQKPPIKIDLLAI
jgi:hypothetical protein